MKTATKSFVALALAICAVSCQKNAAPQESVKKTVDMHIIASQDGSKTSLVAEDGNLVPYWSVGDKLGVAEILYSKYAKSSAEWTGPEDWPEMWYESEPNEKVSAVADFSIRLDARGKESGEQYHYIAVYPSSSFSFCNWTGDEYVRADWIRRWSEMAPDIQNISQIPAHPTAVVEIPIDQTPVPGCFDPAADVLVSDILNTDTQPTSINVAFARVGAILKVNFTGLPAGFKPTNGELTCGESWPAAYMMEYDSYLHRVGVFSKPSNCIRFYLGSYPECDGSAMTVWLRTISGTITDWFNFTIFGTIGDKGVSMKFVKNVELKSALEIPEAEVTEIDVELVRGFDFSAELENMTAGENSLDAAVLFNISGPEITSVEYGIYYNEGEDYESHSTLWNKVVLTPDQDGKAPLNISGLIPGTSYILAPYALVNGQLYWGNNFVIQTLRHYEYAQPEAVDLGLSVKWADFNLGAEKPSGAGYHFAWAETRPSTNAPGYQYKWYTYADGYIKYTISSGEETMSIEDDAARVNLGGTWRLPSVKEWVELKNNCDWAEETLDGVAGIRATSIINGKSIFFPYAGYADYSYENPRHVGDKAGMMTRSYTVGNNCYEVTLPWSYDYCTHAMMQTLVTVRPVK